MTTPQRLIKLLGESGAWKHIGRVHAALYRLTGGRVGRSAGGLSHLLLTTTGARSGLPRTVPLTYLPDGENFVLVASNGGADRHPAWWANLAKTPEATVQVGDRTLAVVAATADPAERARLWPLVTAYNPVYRTYEQLTARTIPVVVLRPRR